jgi:hypothetical protein
MEGAEVLSMRPIIRRAVLLVVIALTAAGCVTSEFLAPSPTVTSANPAWVNWFKLEWDVDAPREGQRRISGYVHNGYGEPARGVQLLTQAFDRSGQMVHQRLDWVHGIVPPLSRSYFVVAGLPPADEYRVTVWDFDFLQSPGWE